MAKNTTAPAESVAVAVPEAPATTKGNPRPRAAVKEIDWSQAATATDLKSVASDRVSVWAKLLDALYEGTAAGKAPRVNGDGELQFVPLGTFQNVGGARTQVKAFEDKGLDKTYDFKTQVVGKTSTLWARVKEVAE